ncbi:hypothetical protein [Glutamicibacter nicotianae]|uniref:hypothetical protein n=1 Tax=Glutamicibacter nicotianae TaxID=37929 RepID=UPI00195C350D|nr:hypothetical protein [Glutamicibacter nicotianae]MBM7767366.1 hypothetical protein [Glutamicibacter nicotianae]
MTKETSLPISTELAESIKLVNDAHGSKQAQPGVSPLDHARDVAIEELGKHVTSLAKAIVELEKEIVFLKAKAD